MGLIYRISMPLAPFPPGKEERENSEFSISSDLSDEVDCYASPKDADIIKSELSKHPDPWSLWSSIRGILVQDPRFSLDEMRKISEELNKIAAAEKKPLETLL